MRRDVLHSFHHDPHFDIQQLNPQFYMRISGYLQVVACCSNCHHAHKFYHLVLSGHLSSPFPFHYVSYALCLLSSKLYHDPNVGDECLSHHQHGKL
uniref:Paired amphipathic helix protein Sin3-like 4 isoform X2 n=1 Tax=Rhizophora mucronata TaxID=61149 RepID=A0A2P2IQS8_RHIMU